MTSPTAKKDKKLGNWTYVCELPYVDYSGEGDKPMNEQAIVHSSNGLSVNMRAKPNTSGALIMRVPNGAKVEIIGSSGDWDEIKYSGKTGWMMAKFLVSGDTAIPDGDTVTVDRKELEKVYDTLGNMLGLRG